MTTASARAKALSGTDSTSVDVSIIIPVWNRQDLLREALESCTQQEGVESEVIVVDDCSPEPVESAIRDFDRVRYLRLPENRGSAAARNQGLADASGRYLKFLDSDDVLTSGALREEIALADSSGADIVVSGWRETRRCGNGDECVEFVREAPCFEGVPTDLLLGKGVPTSAALYRRNAVVGLEWDPSLRKANDWDWFAKCALVANHIVTRQGIAYDWRSHSGERITTSRSVRDSVDSFQRIVRRIVQELERRGLLTPDLRRLAAQYLYKNLRRQAVVDPVRALAVLDEIRALDAAFVPWLHEPSRVFRIAARLGLLSPAIRVYGAMKRVRASPRG